MNKQLQSCFAGMALVAVAMAAAPSASAALTNYHGAFGTDDEQYVLNFHLDKDSTIGARSLSFATGGFATVFSLFGPTGLTQLAVGSANTCGGNSGAKDAATGFCWDAYFSAQLAAGDYTLVLTQDGNLPIGGTLADGFSMTGQPHYTGAWYLGDASRSFINVDGSQRSANWSFDFSTQTVPEPGTWALMALAMLALTATRRSRT